MISQGFWGNLVCISSNPQVICEPSSVDRAVELWWLVACRFSFLGSIRSCLLFSAVAGFLYGLWTHRAWRRENVSNSFGGKHSVSRGIDSGTTTVGVQTVLEGPVFSAFHETGPAAVCVRSGRNPKQENIEIGEFGAGRPDVGGRWPRREALGQKKGPRGSRPEDPHTERLRHDPAGVRQLCRNLGHRRALRDLQDVRRAELRSNPTPRRDHGRREKRCIRHVWCKHKYLKIFPALRFG